MDNVLSKAISRTGIPEQGAVDTTEEAMPEEDGTVTIPMGILPEGVKEGDRVVFEYITETADGCVLKPVETRVNTKDTKNVESVNTAVEEPTTVGVNPTKYGSKI